MGKIIQTVLAFIVGGFIIYLLIPAPKFPSPLPDSPQSQEPGDLRDLETFRAYFTNFSRAEVIAHYQQQFHHPGIFGFIPSYRLNYPPEDAFTYIADQTLSNYLEEIVFPFRESLYVNGYEPGQDDDQIAFEGTPYKAKITIRYYKSNPFTRLFVAALSLIAVWILAREYQKVWKDFWTKNSSP